MDLGLSLKGVFTLTVNERFGLNGGFVGITEWIFGERNQYWNAALSRAVFELDNTFEEAKFAALLLSMNPSLCN